MKTQRDQISAYLLEITRSLVLSILLHDIIFWKSNGNSIVAYISGCILKLKNWSSTIESCDFEFKTSYIFVLLCTPVLTYIFGKYYLFIWTRNKKLLNDIRSKLRI
jgi:hypothetical protein